MFYRFRNTVFLTVTCGAILCAQTASLSVTSASGCPGTVVNVPIALGGGANPAGLQWNLTYPAADVVAQTVTLGSAPTGKFIECMESAGATTWMTCLIYGIDLSTIPNGTVADVKFQIQQGSASSVSIQPSNLAAVTPGGVGIPASGAGGTLTVVPCNCPADLVLANQTLSEVQTLEASSTATLGQNLIVNGADIVVNAPEVTILGDTEIRGTFTLGSYPSCI